MKRFLAVAIVLVTMAGSAMAQGIRFGGKAGANLTKVTGQAFKDGFELGYQLGVFSEIDFTKQWGIQPEVLWNQVNTKPASNANDVLNGWQDKTDNIQLKYLTIPLLLRYSPNELITFNLGPQVGILLDQHETLWNNGKEAVKSGDFSMVGGLQVNLKALRVYGRYNVGLANINDIGTQDKWKSQQLQLGVGVRL